jgi:hypothetical protein
LRVYRQLSRLVRLLTVKRRNDQTARVLTI